MEGRKSLFLPLRKNVCMIVVNQAGLIFLGKRAGTTSVWQLPQGGVEEGSTEEESVYRELTEELGAKRECFSVERRLSAEHSYLFREIPKYAKGKFSGQKQSFWLVAFLGTDNDINLSQSSGELEDFKWCTLKEIWQLAEPVRIVGYRKALKEVLRLAEVSEIAERVNRANKEQ
ncbi:MAG: NUDIX domain-containing protein [Candidatus Dadabacteria bacterium]|nr:MAG: NUDIX domain-containing protein [Candidatus Dadabacteria bacterium]